MPASQEGLARLIDELLGDERISEAFRRVDRAESLTAENIQAAARSYLPLDRYTVVTLLPEEQATASR